MDLFKTGGAKKKMSKKKPMKKSSKKTDDSKRTFKIVEVDGKAVTMGRYTGDNHSTAAKRALASICEKYSNKKMTCKHTFSLQETTRGSDKKIKTFTGERVKTKLPKPIKLSWGMVEYDVKTSIHLLREK